MAFKTKVLDPPPKFIKSSKKLRKLKKLLQKKKNNELMLIKGDQEIDLLRPGQRYAYDNFDPKQVLHTELVDIIDLLAKAKEVYRDLPDGENASSLSMLLREMRGFVGDIYQITQEDKDTIYRKIDNEIIQPFLRRLIKGIITEFDSVRHQLISSVGEDKSDEVTSAIKTAGKNMRPVFTTQYVELMQDIAKALDIKQDIQPLMDKLDLISKI